MWTMSQQTTRRREGIERQCIALEEHILVEVRVANAISSQAPEVLTVLGQVPSSFLEPQGRVSSLSSSQLVERPVTCTRLSPFTSGRIARACLLFSFRTRVHLAACGPLPLAQSKSLGSHHLSTSPVSRTVSPGCGRGRTTIVCPTTLPKKTACTHEVGVPWAQSYITFRSLGTPWLCGQQALDGLQLARVPQVHRTVSASTRSIARGSKRWSKQW